MPHFAARDWPHPRLNDAHLLLFGLGVAGATAALWWGWSAVLLGGLLLQMSGAVAFVIHTILMMVRGAPRAAHAPAVPLDGQRQVDRVGTQATKLAALALPLALLLLAATAQGGLGGAWWLAAEHLTVLGWVMLMVVGVAYHVLPRFSGHPVRGVAWARAQLACHVAAVVVMVPALGFGWSGAFVLGALLMTTALLLFAATVQPAVHRLRPALLTISFNPVKERSP
jgi:hypothetical protein